MRKNLGVQVLAIIELEGKRHNVSYHNVTEIHFNYDYSGRVAFESDIHGTGITWDIFRVKEFTTVLETMKAKSF